MIKNFLKTVLLTTAGVISFSICAPAATSTYTNMDALMGIRVTSGTGSTFDAIIDLGSVSQFNHTFTLSLGDIGGFMTTNFGSDWYTRMNGAQTSVQWAVVAGDFQNFTDQLWTTRNPAVRATPWPRGFDASQSNTASLIDSLGTTYANNTIATGTTSAILQTASGSNTWASFQPGGANSSGISFQTWNPTNEGNTNTVLAFDSLPDAIPSQLPRALFGTRSPMSFA